jgi:hypothetical protein
MFKSWMRLTNVAVLLGLEAQQVISRRLMRIAAGGKRARFETERMVTEKSPLSGKRHRPSRPAVPPARSSAATGPT